MSPARVAVIGHTGRGNYGHQLDQAFVGRDDARIVAVADPDAEGGRAKAAQLGAASHYLDHRELLEKERPDIVVVAPRHLDQHLAPVLDAVAAGAHVYCEKPIAQDLAQADLMVETAREAGVRFGVALPFVHETRFHTLKRLLADGLIGEVLQLKGLCKWDHRGGGQDFLILGVHMADMLRRLAGDPLRCMARVSAGNAPLSRNEVRQGTEGAGLVAGDRIHARYELPGRVIGTIESWRVGLEDRGLQPYRVEIHGTEGILLVRAPYADHSIWHYPLPAILPTGPVWRRIPTDSVPSYGAYHHRAADDFLEAVTKAKDPACSGHDGRAALEMIHAAYHSELSDGPVELPLADRRHPLAIWVDKR